MSEEQKSDAKIKVPSNLHATVFSSMSNTCIKVIDNQLLGALSCNRRTDRVGV